MPIGKATAELLNTCIGARRRPLSAASTASIQMDGFGSSETLNGNLKRSIENASGWRAPDVRQLTDPALRKGRNTVRYPASIFSIRCMAWT